MMFDPNASWLQCPYCGATDKMDRGDTDYTGSEYYETWYCHNCDSQWEEVYKRSHREAIT